MSNSRLPLGLSKNKAALILLGLAIGIFMLLKATKPEVPVDAKAEPVYTVRTLKVEPSERAPVLKLYGKVVAPSRALITASVNANVEHVHKFAGDTAQAGDILLELDPAEAEIALTQARSNMQQAEAQLRLDSAQRQTNLDTLDQERELLSIAERAVGRAVRLRDQGVLSEADVDATKRSLQQQKLTLAQRKLAVQQADAITLQLKAQLASAEARLQRAELDLARTQVHLNFDSAVIATHVAPGDRVIPGNPLIEVYDRALLEIRAQIPGRHLATLQKAMNNGVTVTAQARHNGQIHTAKLSRIANNAGGGGQDAYFRLASGSLPVDSTLSVQIELPAEEQAVALPYDAIYDLSRVFKIQGDRLVAITVDTLGDYLSADGKDSTQFLLVRSKDLRQGDEVVISQLPNAVTGLKVQSIAQ